MKKGRDARSKDQGNEKQGNQLRTMVVLEKTRKPNVFRRNTEFEASRRRSTTINCRTYMTAKKTP